MNYLVPEKGKGIDKPYRLRELGINATALRFLDFLYQKTIKIKIHDFRIILPHPVNFALHKLIIFQRREKADKAVKDRNTAIDILKALLKKGEEVTIKQVFKSMHRKWQNKVINGLKELKENDILDILKSGITAE